jgi:hypothetical protein
MSASRSTANLKQGNKYFVNLTNTPQVFIVDANGNIPDTTLGTAFAAGGSAVGNYITLPTTEGNLYLRDMGETIRVNYAALTAGTLAAGKAAYPLDTIFRKVQQVSTPSPNNEGVDTVGASNAKMDVYYIAFGAGSTTGLKPAFNNWADAGLP